jgi:hypothetical protein
MKPDKDFTILEKLKILIDSVGRLDSPAIMVTAEKFIHDITIEVFSGNTDKVPDEVWDYMKTLPKEIQMFMLSGFASAIITSEKAKQQSINENGGIPKEIIKALETVLGRQVKFEEVKLKKEEPIKSDKQKEPETIHIFRKK